MRRCAQGAGRLLQPASCALLACSSGGFDVAASHDDSGTIGGDTASDSAPPIDSPADGLTDVNPSCVFSPASADVYVDVSSTKPSNGTAGGIGIVFNQVGSATIDLGNSTDPGNNALGGVLHRNGLAALCVSMPAGGTVSAESNSWSHCAPSTAKNDPCAPAGLTGYSDVVYAPLGLGASPVDATPGCSVGS